MPAGYAPRLLPEEVAPGGLFRDLHRWLDGNIARFGFFRPYNYDLGGMYPEPWHLSHAATAEAALSAVSLDLLRTLTEASDMEGKAIALERLPWIYERHILNFVRPDAQRPVVQ
jgi:hypothetical protein